MDPVDRTQIQGRQSQAGLEWKPDKALEKQNRG